MSAAAQRTRGLRGVSSGEALSLGVYVVVVIGLFACAAAMMRDLFDAHSALDDGRDALARLERLAAAKAPSGAGISSSPLAPPFLTGATITIGGASLQARVETAAKKAGAKTLSSQIDLQGPRVKEGFIGLTENLEIAQGNLQGLLYDLEAGLPYIFVDNLEVESPEAFGEAEGARMRVKIGVTGQWREAK